MRTWQIWFIFCACLTLVSIILGWFTHSLIQLDRSQDEAQYQAVIEERVRLALWRIDSALATLVAQENVRPYFVYSPCYPVDRAYTRMFAEVRRGDILTPSPLLGQFPAYTLVHFQFGPDGAIGSPQVPTANMYDLADMDQSMREKIETAQRRIGDIENCPVRDKLLRNLPRPTGAVSAEFSRQTATSQIAQQAFSQKIDNAREWQARNRSYLDAVQNKIGRATAPVAVHEGFMAPVWVGDFLILARRVAVDDEEYLQGCSLDWPGIKQWTIMMVQDLLPEADLEPVEARETAKPTRMLATLPVRIVPGAVPREDSPDVSPIDLSLLAAWSCALTAAVAVAVLLMGVISLSERRGNFVSAVTHELRTPLTTFRMYTEMLGEGMVSTPEKRSQYLSTLRREADRLGHLVENVLAYARLERNRAPRNIQDISLGELVRKVEDRLHRHARHAGMEWQAEIEDAAEVRTDVAAVEQILFNLVDNACKYASGPGRAIYLKGQAQGKWAVLSVADNGPGIENTRRLFRPFCKSSQDAANSAPGVGLGLALSRRLARHIGGNLTFDSKNREGSRFLLALPIKREVML